MKKLFLILIVVLVSSVLYSCKSSSSSQKAIEKTAEGSSAITTEEQTLDQESKTKIEELAEKRLQIYCKMIKAAKDSPTTGINAPEQQTSDSPELSELDREIGAFCNTQLRLSYYQKVWADVGSRGCRD